MLAYSLVRMDTSSPNVESTAGLLVLFQTTFPLARREGGSRTPSVSSNSYGFISINGRSHCAEHAAMPEFTTLLADDFARPLPPPKSHFSAASSASVHSGHMVGFLTVSLQHQRDIKSNDPVLSPGLYLCEAELTLSLEESCFPRPPCCDLPGIAGCSCSC